ncbi:DUF2069 domain-containing protein [Methylonatrum kenyense]|uniref:DUF2069 domain-containing protein n=1 Tax=Methylonatrum kenyense TaxID=455253 RepID=UPI0020C16403|nr:DUF2069 domain-containing protein [Methylonatrum kenyense]MCK8516084.1 DUF2069 domain-containing protein [Methylonatrum kenyense]
MTRLLHGMMLLGLLGLLSLQTAWLTWLAPPPEGLTAPMLLLLGGPLLLPLRGLLAARRYTAAWCSLLALLYFAHGVAAMGTPGTLRMLGGIEVLLSLLLFASCLLYVRATRSRVQDRPST